MSSLSADGVSADGAPARFPAASRRGALLALLLLVPAPTLGTLAAMWIWPDTTFGKVIYGASKVWILVLPLVWTLWVQRERPSWSPPRRGGLGVGLGLGAFIAVAIVAAYLIVGGEWIDPAAFRETATENGFGTPGVYLGFAVYLATVNALLEEYVWRWFVFRRCEELVPARVAVPLSALLFTLHHVFALADQFDWKVTTLGCVGVFVGGALWSWCYLRYRSIWPGYISHALADVAFLVIGWTLLFGA